EGAHFGHDLALELGGGDLSYGIQKRLRFGQARQDDRRRGRPLGGVIRKLDAGTLGLPAFGGADVITDYAPAGGDQILRERTAHNTEADHTNRTFGLSCHSLSPDANASMWSRSVLCAGPEAVESRGRTRR